MKSRWLIEDDGAPSRRRPLHRTRRRITLLVRNSACCRRLSRGGIATWLKSTDFCHPWHNISQQSGGHDVGRADGSGSTKFSKWKNRTGGSIVRTPGRRRAGGLQGARFRLFRTYGCRLPEPPGRNKTTGRNTRRIQRLPFLVWDSFGSIGQSRKNRADSTLHLAVRCDAFMFSIPDCREMFV